MSEWEKCTLGNAPFEIIDGDRGKNYPKQEDFFTIEHCLFLNAKNITTSGFAFDELNFITKERDQLLKKGKLLRNDSVLTTRGTVGHIGFYNESVPFDEIRINSGMVIIRPNGIDERFNYCLFKYLNKDFDVFVSGSAQPQLPIRDLKQIEFLLPPLPEQKAIASVLSSLDDKIDLLHRQNKTLEAMAETLFRQWFVEEATNDYSGKISDLIDIQNGFAFSSKDFKELGINEVIKIKNISGNIVDIYNTDFIDDSVVKNMNKRFQINTGDVLFAMTGAEIGKMGIVPKTTRKLWLNQRVGLFKEKFEGARFLAFLQLISDFGQDYIENTATGSAQPNISSTGITNCDFPHISKEHAMEYSTLLSEMFAKIIFNIGQTRTLERLHDTLLPKLMSGKVHVE